AGVFALGLRPLEQLEAALGIDAREEGAVAGEQAAEPAQARQRLGLARGRRLARPGVVVERLELGLADRVPEAGGGGLERRRPVPGVGAGVDVERGARSEEHTSELQ